MELRHLRYFVAIAEEGSFTRAAERLWIAQPGLSTQMRRLEAELGVKLFERHARGADLTSSGKLFLERARAALAAAEIAAATGGDLAAGTTGTLRLGLAAGPSWSGTGELLERFARLCAGVELTVLEGFAGTLWRDLRDGRLDALLAPAAVGAADLTTLELGAEPWLALVGARHRLSRQGPLERAELQGEQIAVTAHRDAAWYDRAVAELLEAESVTAALVPSAYGPALDMAVASGETIVLTTAPGAVADGVVVRPLAGAPLLPFSLLWSDGVPSPALARFVEIASEQVRDRNAPTTRALRAVA
jgi:DNA-binding transcriptional LysR family regulator